MTYEEVTKEALLDLFFDELVIYYSKSGNPLAVVALYEKYPESRETIDELIKHIDEDTDV